MALSLSPARRMFRVIFPQGWALMIPSLATLQIQLLKGTAVASFITLQDLNDRIDILRQATGDTMFSYTVGLLIYFVLAWLIQVGMDALERSAKRRLGRGDGKKGLFSRLTGRPEDEGGDGMSWWNWQSALDALPLLLQGFGTTLVVTIGGTVIAVFLGLLIRSAAATFPPG